MLQSSSVISFFHARSGVRPALSALAAMVGLTLFQPAFSQSMTGPGDDLVLRARDAYRQRDQAGLAALRDALVRQAHPLAGWADYWAMQVRLKDATPAEVDQYLSRWGQDYVADRLRNDWLLELGRRRDWLNFARIQPDFRMDDDPSVTCYGLLAGFSLSRGAATAASMADQARDAWWALKQPDEACHAMAQEFVNAGLLSAADIWRKVWLANDQWKPQMATQAMRLLDTVAQQAATLAMTQPSQFLLTDAATQAGQGRQVSRTVPGPDRWVKGKRRPGKSRVVREWVPPPPLPDARDAGPLNVLAFQRWGSDDVAAAAAALQHPDAARRWHLSREEQAWAWASLGRLAASNLKPQALSYFERAHALVGVKGASQWSPETLSWWARSALRTASAGQRSAWTQLNAAIDAMPADMRQDPTWQYWHARTHLALAGTGAAEEAKRQEALQMLVRLAARPVGFYNLLARDDLGDAAPRLPAKPAPLAANERAQARTNAGLDRALRLYTLELRSEGAREWNYNIAFNRPGGMTDRELMAAADWACERQVWDRCINTSERTKQEFNLAQRFPTPYKDDIVTAAQSVGLDPAYMFGLIRQESRFQPSAKSTVGASGLMQVMPATAAWTARKLGMTDYRQDLLHDPETNLRLGAGYLKLMIDEFSGSQAMAAAGYNAGPNRPRRWRDGPLLDGAAWAENIPFTETRDYVKKVLANAAAYAHLLHGKSLSLRPRLGNVGPRLPSQGADNTELP